jgi:hypothetical protein
LTLSAPASGLICNENSDLAMFSDGKHAISGVPALTARCAFRRPARLFAKR